MRFSFKALLAIAVAIPCSAVSVAATLGPTPAPRSPTTYFAMGNRLPSGMPYAGLGMNLIERHHARLYLESAAGFGHPQLPSMVGMNSLLPGADRGLHAALSPVLRAGLTLSF